MYGVDFSSASVAIASKLNRRSIEHGKVEIVEGSVSQLPFPADTFDVVTAVETHFWWPDLENDIRETLRVLKPGGRLICVAEIFKGANTAMSRLAEKHEHKHGMTLLNIDEHRELLRRSGYADVQIEVESEKGWICAMGNKPRVATTAKDHE